jgi:hypothetical protein
MAQNAKTADKLLKAKRALKDPVEPAPKRQLVSTYPRETNSSTAQRPSTSDSSASGKTGESKDEEFSRDLLLRFVDEVMVILGDNELRLTWPKSRYYISLTSRYETFLQS